MRGAGEVEVADAAAVEGGKRVGCCCGLSWLRWPWPGAALRLRDSASCSCASSAPSPSTIAADDRGELTAATADMARGKMGGDHQAAVQSGRTRPPTTRSSRADVDGGQQNDL